MADNYPSVLCPFVDGRWLQDGGRDQFPIFNPANGIEVGAVTLVAEADLDEALAAADAGFKSWRATAPDSRSAALQRTANLLRERVDQIARLVTVEQGKTLGEARREVLSAATLVDFHAGEAVRAYGRVLMRPAGTRSMVLPQPVGPVAAFCAWNFPALNVVRKLAPAIAAGCSIILKPSEETPASAVAVLRCFLDAGVPGNVAQLVFGDPDQISRRLLVSPVTRKLSFTGSVPVGKHLMRLAADTVMRMTLELGGHAPVLLFDDCDLNKALDMLVAQKFLNAGQVCVSPTRFYVQETVYEDFVAGFAERTRALKVGDGLDPASQMGPMANTRRPKAIRDLVDDAKAAGARLLTADAEASFDGYFVRPAVLADVPLTARAMQDEPFGPLALVRPFATLDDAIEEANRLPYGLATYCFTENARRQNILADALEAGMIAINGVRLTWPDSPFGGMKDSGFGSEDGPEGLAAHMITKAVHIS